LERPGPFRSRDVIESLAKVSKKQSDDFKQKGMLDCLMPDGRLLLCPTVRDLEVRRE
jgi:hypothetical protein